VTDTNVTPTGSGAVPASADGDNQLVIRDLHVVPVADPSREILAGVDLTVPRGEVHAIMGPNGSGKTTLAYALMGHPAYRVTQGSASWKGMDILGLSPDKRRAWGSSLPSSTPPRSPASRWPASCALR